MALPIKPAALAPVTLEAGQGPDALVLKVAQDAYLGSAQYTVKVDGKQIGGIFTAAASHGTGEFDTLTLRGNWAPGSHTVQIYFVNDLYGGSAFADRNLYIDAATLNGASIADAHLDLPKTGAASFSFTRSGPPPATSQPVTLEAGQGSDAIVLKVSQDAYLGSAQYIVSIDGRQIGGIFTASALHGTGQFDTLTLRGDWDPGSHRVQIHFLNDLYGGDAKADRNLYIDTATFNGATVPSSHLDLPKTGTATFAFTEGSASPTPEAGTGPDTLVLKISQDAYLGNAEYTVSVDGQQIGGVFTASALRSAGKFDTVTLHGDWGPGSHDVQIHYLNDLYGSAGADRNLYVGAAIYNGAAVPGSRLNLYSNGTASFSFTESSPPPDDSPSEPAHRPLLGVYEGNDPATVTQFEQWFGRPTDGVLGYTGDQTWSDMDPSWIINRLPGPGHAVFFSIPLFPQTSSLAAVADGAGDAYFRSIAETILANADRVAAPDGSIYVRTAWEVGGDWFWWSQQALDRPDHFIRAFQHFADAFHAVSDRFKIVWDTAGERGDPARFYPGDKYVDVVSRDVYWTPPWHEQDGSVAFANIRDSAYGLQWVENFADQHGKPTAISEWGVPAGYDGTTFIQAMKNWFDDPEHHVLYQTYWDSDFTYSGRLSDGSDPVSGAAYRDAFGAGI